MRCPVSGSFKLWMYFSLDSDFHIILTITVYKDKWTSREDGNDANEMRSSVCNGRTTSPILMPRPSTDLRSRDQELGILPVSYGLRPDQGRVQKNVEKSYGLIGSRESIDLEKSHGLIGSRKTIDLEKSHGLSSRS